MRFATSLSTARPWRPWILSLLLWLALATLTGLASWHQRRLTLDGQARETELLSLALADEIDRGLQGVEEGLQAMGRELQEGRLPARGPELDAELERRALLMPLVSTLWLLDGEARPYAASAALPPPVLARFYPAPEQQASDAGRPSSLSQPFVDPATGQTLVGLAARLPAHPGMAARWVLAALPADALLGAFGAALPAADARIGVFRADGVRLAGTHAGPRAQRQLLAQREVGRYGLRLVIARELAVVLAPWRAAAGLATTALLLLLLVMAAALYRVQRAERRRAQAQQALQAQRARASKLESLGTLAGGVSHDFNNVLAAILGFGEMAQDAAVPGSAQARHLDKVMQAALRGKSLVERILAFSRGGARASTVFELAPVVEEVLTLLAASLKPGVVLERALEAPGARVRGDPTQAFEAVMNLCTNAMQAMPDGGMLSVQLWRDRVATSRVLSHSALAPGDYLALSVSDQGAGITPAVMERLFEPFFTTRAAQSGTGLGLAVVHGVVAEFGGAVDVRSQAGQGARFTLYFPECAQAAVVPELADDALPSGRGQVLMVVDDEPALVALAEELLVALGYVPVGFTDPQAALQALAEAPDRYAALLSDEVMPGLSGTALTEAARAHSPGLPVLLISGYGGALLARRAAQAGVSRVLSKPLRRAELAQALSELLR
jgi:signal transduction histidine kinase